MDIKFHIPHDTIHQAPPLLFPKERRWSWAPGAHSGSSRLIVPARLNGFRLAIWHQAWNPNTADFVANPTKIALRFWSENPSGEYNVPGVREQTAAVLPRADQDGLTPDDFPSINVTDIFNRFLANGRPFQFGPVGMGNGVVGPKVHVSYVMTYHEWRIPVCECQNQ